MPPGVLMDTWGWLALSHRRDAHHRRVKSLHQQLRQGKTILWTTDYILDEFITLLFRRVDYAEAVSFLEGILASAVIGEVVIERITAARFAEAWKLRQRFRDKPLISFTDLTTMVLMNEVGLKEIVTEDSHFLHAGTGFKKIP